MHEIERRRNLLPLSVHTWVCYRPYAFDRFLGGMHPRTLSIEYTGAGREGRKQEERRGKSSEVL